MVYLVLFYGSWGSNGGAAGLVSCGIAFYGEMPSADRFSYHSGRTAGALVFSLCSSSFLYYDAFVAMTDCSDRCIIHQNARFVKWLVVQVLEYRKQLVDHNQLSYFCEEDRIGCYCY